MCPAVLSVAVFPVAIFPVVVFPFLPYFPLFPYFPFFPYFPYFSYFPFIPGLERLSYLLLGDAVDVVILDMTGAVFLTVADGDHIFVSAAASAFTMRTVLEDLASLLLFLPGRDFLLV